MNLAASSPTSSGRVKPTARGYQIVETYVGASASASNDRRPEVQRMIERRTSKLVTFDAVVVRSGSRFSAITSRCIVQSRR